MRWLTVNFCMEFAGMGIRTPDDLLEYIPEEAAAVAATGLCPAEAAATVATGLPDCAEVFEC